MAKRQRCDLCRAHGQGPPSSHTDANHFLLGTGDAGFWSDCNGNPITPPANEIANPNPVAGTTNKYTADNNFTDCSQFTQPGVAPIVSYLEALSYRPEPNCA